MLLHRLLDFDLGGLGIDDENKLVVFFTEARRLFGEADSVVTEWGSFISASGPPGEGWKGVSRDDDLCVAQQVFSIHVFGGNKLHVLDVACGAGEVSSSKFCPMTSTFLAVAMSAMAFTKDFVLPSATIKLSTVEMAPSLMRAVRAARKASLRTFFVVVFDQSRLRGQRPHHHRTR